MTRAGAGRHHPADPRAAPPGGASWRCRAARTHCGSALPTTAVSPWVPRRRRCRR
ncbi:hypothetical protein HBB16_13385 [Pseudonocardia sp. MCCB 268]|nr:hypothetical protein [Pseudonocardia cytotoxica]